MKLVSIIIPYVRDRGYLQQAIDSVFAQDYPNIEIIQAQSENGVSFNLNKGIEAATGEYIKYLCDDDYLPPNSISLSVKHIRGSMALHGQAIDFFELPAGRKEKKYIPPIEHPTLERMLISNVIHGGTLMYHRSVFEKFGTFDETLWTGEEYEFNMRLIYNNVKFAYCPHPLYYYRRHQQQKSLGCKDIEYQTARKQEFIKIRARYSTCINTNK